MAAVVLLARESGRAGAAATALGWAVALLLLVDPATVGDPGFQLSVLATAGLIAWATPITERLRSGDAGRLPGWLAESLGVSFAAEAATLPVVLAGFGRFALLAPAVNLVVVPLVPPAMAAGTLALVGGWLGTGRCTVDRGDPPRPARLARPGGPGRGRPSRGGAAVRQHRPCLRHGSVAGHRGRLRSCCWSPPAAQTSPRAGAAGRA